MNSLTGSYLCFFLSFLHFNKVNKNEGIISGFMHESTIGNLQNPASVSADEQCRVTEQTINHVS